MDWLLLSKNILNSVQEKNTQAWRIILLQPSKKYQEMDFSFSDLIFFAGKFHNQLREILREVVM